VIGTYYECTDERCGLIGIPDQPQRFCYREGHVSSGMLPGGAPDEPAFRLLRSSPL
jgi:hypothetical protein